MAFVFEYRNPLVGRPRLLGRTVGDRRPTSLQEATFLLCWSRGQMTALAEAALGEPN